MMIIAIAMTFVTDTAEYSANRNRPVSTSRVSQADLAAYSSANYIGGGKRSGGRSRDKKRLYIIIGVVAVLLVALVAAAFAAVGSAKEMKSQATQVLQDVKSIQTAIGENDYAAARAICPAGKRADRKHSRRAFVALVDGCLDYSRVRSGHQRHA